MNSNIYNNMKTFSLLFIISLLINGGFTDEVSVIEGDSVTLHTETEIQSKDMIEWWFGDKQDFVARLDKESNEMLYSQDKRFRDRLKLNNKNGDLTITNITTEHMGVLKVDVAGRITTTKPFSVTVFGDAGEVKSVSVKEGDSVTLYADVGYMDNYDVIRWRFQHGDSPLAVIDKKSRIFSIPDDERFKNKLHLDLQTGDLTIRRIRSDHSGLYEVNIDSISRTHTIQQIFTVTVSGAQKTLSVMRSSSVTLNTDTEVQRGDRILWEFVSDDTRIAEIYQPNNIFTTYNYGRFKDRLMLNNQTGSIIITNIRSEDSGLYQLKISSRRRSIQRKFNVNVTLLTQQELYIVVASVICGVVLLLVISVAAVYFYYRRFPIARRHKAREGRSVVLHADDTILRFGFIHTALTKLWSGMTHTAVKELQRDDVIEWRFVPQNTVIAEIKGRTLNTYDGDDERFKNKLKLKNTGSLTISNITSNLSGLYELKSIKDGKTFYKRYRLTVTDRRDSVDIY
ncbi:uncharacterized protein LOC130429559 [Triplophysa dalaica]|uniref:uncharacterized protein LOC130429559 n=1 Tax=Triplophysa dalaica TaxID=1582913 RepID=UPI0024DFDABF|nr:uncharacterized protein LOC130429559 [Triplophysa dalaica]